MLQKLGAFDRVSKGELLGRIEGLKELMAKQGIDFVIIMRNVDLFYFTGTAQKGLLVIAPGHPPLLFVEKSVTRARLDTSLDVIPIRTDRDAGQILAEKKILRGQGAMELDMLPVKVYERFKNSVGYNNFVDASLLISELRTIKSPFELEQIKKAGAIFNHVFARAKEVIREGVSEVEIDADLVAEGRKQGHQGYPRVRGFNQDTLPLCVFSGFSTGISSYFDAPITGVGLTPAMPQGASFLRVERGNPVIVDYCGCYNGYCSDETRVFTVGEQREIFKKPCEVAREILEDAESFGKAGVDTTELFNRAMQRVKKAGLENHFMGHGEGQVSFIGHGLGLEMNELPIITARHSRILQEGMVFAYEPKFVFPGEGAVGLELSFIVRKNGLERISDIPLDVVCL